ncbi:MAG TPA: regulatory iron-sulfur-containing complex subunit RicT [Hanamia sp.]
MGCTSCGTGKPNGCKSNGGCSSGGCNRLNVYDWLADLPVDDVANICRIIEVSFNQGSRKDFYKNNTSYTFYKGDVITVEGVSGFDVGTVNLTGELVRLQLKKKRIDENSVEIKKILRLASDNDIAKWKETKAREREVLIRSRAIARQLKLDLKMSEVEIQADARKATFFYIADERVDFRELIRIYATEFKVKVEMKQIGARQEAGKVGGIGSCGRELCCSTWLTDFKSVNTNAARYQNLSINQTKLSGQCGRLKCCLNYELDTYLDALQYFPEDADVIEVAKGRAFLVKKDIFRNLMWYSMADSTKHYPLTIESVKRIKEQNKAGIKPEALETVEIVSGKPKEVEPEFVDVVGQITLKSLDKNNRKRKGNERRGNPNDKSQSPVNKAPHQNQQNQRPTQNQQQRPPQNQQQLRPPQNQRNRPRPNNNNRNAPPNTGKDN